MLLDIQRLKNGQFAKRLSWDPYFLGIKNAEFLLYGIETNNETVTSKKEVWNLQTKDLLADDWEYFLDPYGYNKVKEPLPPVILESSYYNVPPTITPFKPYTNPLF